MPARGNVGAFNLHRASSIVADMLFGITHRGEVAFGSISTDGQKMFPKKGHDSVEGTYRYFSFESQPGRQSIGQTSVFLDDRWRPDSEIYPMQFDDTRFGPLALTYNGVITNRKELYAEMLPSGTNTDSIGEILVHLICSSGKPELVDAIIAALGQLEGAFTVIIMSCEQMFVARSPNGTLPISIGILDSSIFDEEQKGVTGRLKLDIPESGVLVSTENYVFRRFARHIFMRYIEPGEIAVMSKTKPTPEYVEFGKSVPVRLCVNEILHVAHPRTKLVGCYFDHDPAEKRNRDQGVRYERIRQNCGYELGLQYPEVSGDCLVPELDIALNTGEGFGKQRQIADIIRRYLLRNHHQPNLGRPLHQLSFAEKVSFFMEKYDLGDEKITGKHILLMLGAFTTGDNARILTDWLMDCGALEVTALVPYSRIISPCPYKLIPEPYELLQAAEEISKGVRFLSIQGMRKAFPESMRDELCMACYTPMTR